MWPFEKPKSRYVLPELPPVDSVKLSLPPTDVLAPRSNTDTLPAFPPQENEPTLELPDSILPATTETRLPSLSEVDVPAPAWRGQSGATTSSTIPLDGITLWICNGTIVKNLNDLASALLAMSDATFHYHVNAERNDFASWIQDVLGERELAMRLSLIHKREDFLNVIASHFSKKPTKQSAATAKRQAKEFAQSDETKKYAYLGLRGSVTSLQDGINFVAKPGGVQRTADLKAPASAPAISAAPLSARKTYTPASNPRAGKMALSQLDSMQEPDELIARLQPKGTMLQELLKKRAGRAAANVMKQTRNLPMTMPEHHLAIQSAISSASTTLPPLTLPAIPVAKMRITKGQKESMDYEAVRRKLEAAKEQAERKDVGGAQKMLREVKALIKERFKGNRRPFQYEIWEAENTIRQASLA